MVIPIWIVVVGAWVIYIVGCVVGATREERRWIAKMKHIHGLVENVRTDIEILKSWGRK